MKKYRRYIVQKDNYGRVLLSKDEQVLDNEMSIIYEPIEIIVGRCESCNSPIEKLEQMREYCISCGKSCCSKCLTYCNVCHSPLCGHCRHGFAPKRLSVCSSCLAELEERLNYEDVLQEEQLELQKLKSLFARRHHVR